MPGYGKIIRQALPANPQSLAELSRAVQKALDEVYRFLEVDLDNYVKTVTAAYTLTFEDFAIHADATGGAFTVTLLPAADARGRDYTIKKIDATANVTVAADGSETIDGAASVTLSTQWQAVTVRSNGTAWFVVAT